MTASEFLVAADTATVAIPLAALFVSALALFNGFLSRRDAESDSRLSDLERQVTALKEENKECGRERTRLERENVALMRQVFKLENGHDQ